LDGLGISAIDGGFNVIVNPNDTGNITSLFSGTNYYMNGIYMPLSDEIHAIKFKVRINNTTALNTDLDISFFFGAINPGTVGINNNFGNLVGYKHVTLGDNVANLIQYFQNPLNSTVQTITTFNPSEDQDIVIIFGDSLFSVEINGIPLLKLKDIPLYPSSMRNFCFGYVVPLYYSSSVSISDWKINP